MKTLITLFLFLGAFAQAQEPTLKCESGPANKIYGGNPWYVYACDDKRSVVVITAPGNKAMPFYFMFSFQDGAYRLIGEGTGDKAITDAVYKQLSALRPNEIAELHNEALRATKK